MGTAYLELYFFLCLHGPVNAVFADSSGIGWLLELDWARFLRQYARRLDLLAAVPTVFDGSS